MNNRCFPLPHGEHLFLYSVFLEYPFCTPVKLTLHGNLTKTISIIDFRDSLCKELDFIVYM